MASRTKIVVTGAAGLVGQNLLKLLDSPENEVVAIDKNAANMAVLERFHPEVTTIVADLAEPGAWEEALVGCEVLVIGQAQIGGLHYDEFERNNIRATELLLAAAERNGLPYIVQISSSVVNSMAHDFYTESKKAQEKLAAASPIPHIILRPTLMFGWFDRKHMGWLARFMEKAPVFPIPGDGRYLRQPLYVQDFAAIIASAIRSRITGSYNITGQQRIDYIDLMRAVKKAIGARAPIVRIPYGLFWLLLKSYALVSKNPPFTTSQLKALATPDVFEIIDWPAIFGVPSTPLDRALSETFGHPEYSTIALQF